MLLHERATSMMHCTGPRASHRPHITTGFRVSHPRAPYLLRDSSQPIRSPVSIASSLTAQIEKEKQANGDILQQMLNYQYEVELPEGQLVIAAMPEELLPRCADLLAETFVDVKGFQAYRRYVRKNILTYLEQHHKMPPSALVLTAILHTTVTVSKDADTLMMEGSLPELQSGSNSSSNTGNGTAASSSSSSSASAAGSSDASSSQTSTCSSSSQQLLTHSSRTDEISSSSSSSSSRDGLRDVVGAVVQHLASGLGLQQQQQVETRVMQQLVGIAEVSFREFTRSSYLTLNPPKKCAYLCNMAVATDWRRKGIASLLITAAEDYCTLAGEHDVYLHLRCKDSDVAGGLYTKAGFTSCKQDWPLVLLLGLEPRYLMRKQLSADRKLVGKVMLPQQQQQQLQLQQPAATLAQPAAAASPAA